MTQLELFEGEKCVLCGRFFVANPRLGDRQKCCGRPACGKQRKRLQERAWRRKNPDYFRGRYEYVKGWREAHPGYQKGLRCKRRHEIQTPIRPKSPIKSMRLVLRCKWPLGEIQTQLLRVTQVGQAFWVDGVRTQAA